MIVPRLPLQAHPQQKIIAFTLTCACVDLYATVLKRLPEASGLSITALHGRMKQSQRQASLAAFATQPSGIGSSPSHILEKKVDQEAYRISYQCLGFLRVV